MHKFKILFFRSASKWKCVLSVLGVSLCSWVPREYIQSSANCWQLPILCSCLFAFLPKMLLTVENESRRHGSCGMRGVDKRWGLGLAWSRSPLLWGADRQMISPDKQTLFTPPARDSARQMENTEPKVLERKTERGNYSDMALKVALGNPWTLIHSSGFYRFSHSKNVNIISFLSTDQ